MTLPALLGEIRERTEENANMSSDDFGHDCQELLVAESQALQTASIDIAALLRALELCLRQRNNSIGNYSFNTIERVVEEREQCDAAIIRALKGEGVSGE